MTEAAESPSLALVVAPDDPVAAAPPVAWASDQLRDALTRHGVGLHLFSTLDRAAGHAICLLAAGPDSSLDTRLAVPATAESLALGAYDQDGRRVVEARGRDPRGLAYALTELADRLRHEARWQDAFRFSEPLIESPSIRVRSIARAFCSRSEDMAWFHDRAAWCAYLDNLVTNRFNRFALTLGMQYNYPYHNEWITDTYLYFPYPFLLAVPGYDVHVPELPEPERQQNLDTLCFIGREAARRGLDFQLALWTHGYDFDDVPHASHNVRGITRDNHAAYCRDALALLLKACPAITGLTLRVHVEGGIAEGDYAFWRVLFAALRAADHPIELDLHAKGIDPVMIETALATGMPVTISPKYIAEHMALPYHQAGIRPIEQAPRARVGARAGFSEGARNFMRYSYGDLLREDRRYGVLFRIWPGTQRVLLWGDPALAAGYGRSAGFCGALGVEQCEPLFFAGRMGSASPGMRLNYADASLRPDRDWEKYRYQYRVWGRLTYNPAHPADGWQRHLRYHCGQAAPALETALAKASRVLPLVTLAFAPSASNNNYWPELHQNMSLVAEPDERPHGMDTPKPARFGTASPMDPQLFLNPQQFAAGLIAGALPAKYTPFDVALWLDSCAAAAEQALGQARECGEAPGPEARRIALDAGIQAALGRAFAAKLRAASWWELFLACGDAAAAEEALSFYRAVRDAWQRAADLAGGVYLPHLNYGPQPFMQGSWADRLPAIDADIAVVRDQAAGAAVAPDRADGAAAIAAMRGWTPMPRPAGQHETPNGFTRGTDLTIAITGSAAPAWLHYRHVNQAEPWQRVAMQMQNGRQTAAIPGAYTDSAYPLQYYLEVRDGGVPGLLPGLAPDLANEPYFTIRPR
jgi:hypothetical protein